MIQHPGGLLPCLVLTTFAAAATAGCATAQQPATPAPATSSMPVATATPVLKVGDPAPDFALPGATRYGVLARPVKLSDHRGQTVVLAFFFKARTKG